MSGAEKAYRLSLLAKDEIPPGNYLKCHPGQQLIRHLVTQNYDQFSSATMKNKKVILRKILNELYKEFVFVGWDLDVGGWIRIPERDERAINRIYICFCNFKNRRPFQLAAPSTSIVTETTSSLDRAIGDDLPNVTKAPSPSVLREFNANVSLGNVAGKQLQKSPYNEQENAPIIDKQPGDIIVSHRSPTNQPASSFKTNLSFEDDEDDHEGINLSFFDAPSVDGTIPVDTSLGVPTSQTLLTLAKDEPSIESKIDVDVESTAFPSHLPYDEWNGLLEGLNDLSFVDAPFADDTLAVETTFGLAVSSSKELDGPCRSAERCYSFDQSFDVSGDEEGEDDDDYKESDESTDFPISENGERLFTNSSNPGLSRPKAIQFQSRFIFRNLRDIDKKRDRLLPSRPVDRQGNCMLSTDNPDPLIQAPSGEGRPKNDETRNDSPPLPSGQHPDFFSYSARSFEDRILGVESSIEAEFHLSANALEVAVDAYRRIELMAEVDYVKSQVILELARMNLLFKQTNHLIHRYNMDRCDIREINRQIQRLEGEKLKAEERIGNLIQRQRMIRAYLMGNDRPCESELLSDLPRLREFEYLPCCTSPKVYTPSRPAPTASGIACSEVVGKETEP